ncbi:MAG: ATPase, T2SS/T4P/T4SS family [Candidatus Micrarchaeota archaeon]
MCKPNIRGTKCTMDCLSCPYELFSADCINSQLKDLTTLSDVNIKTIRYEEEIIIDFDEEKTSILTEYANIARQIEAIISNPKTYGLKDDDSFGMRKQILQKFYKYLFMNPVLAVMTLEEYNEPPPTRGMFMEGYKHFRGWVNGIIDKFPQARLYILTKKYENMRNVFLSLAGLKSLQFISAFILSLPPEAELVDDPENDYSLAHGIKAKIYTLPNSEANLYIQENPLIEDLNPEMQKIMKDAIVKGLVPTIDKTIDFTTIYETKMREHREQFITLATSQNIALSPQQALAMAREVVNWTVGLGSPFENICLDRDNITDIYCDGQNSPVYIEHAKFGLCHTLWRYNDELLNYAIKNIRSYTKIVFDGKRPIVDTMMTRLNLRIHMQMPPATFGEIQVALRLTKEKPFTYSQYLHYNSMTPFFAGYDNLLVSMGCSEAVVGIKGVGKTAFTSAKIIGIGTKKRILPIQDIEEIPVNAYRKRGFHIGAMRVQSSDMESASSSELSLIAMANASLRMGDSCLIINEVRSRVAIQGIINLLNTQPGVFCLYNLHAKGIKDIQDRFELVFGVPSASMFATDRYSFLRKIKFSRKGRVFRLLAKSIETDPDKRKFIDVFKFKRGQGMKDSVLNCLFLDNPEASAWDLSDLDLAQIEDELSINFIPPALQRRSDEAGVSPNQCIMQAFFKGKVYSSITRDSNALSMPELMDIDFVLRCDSAANKLLKELERENGSVDYKALAPIWEKRYKEILKSEIGSGKTQQASGKGDSGAIGMGDTPQAPADTVSNGTEEEAQPQ